MIYEYIMNDLIYIYFCELKIWIGNHDWC